MDTHDSRICHRPLCRASNTLVQFALIGIMTSSCICQEQCVDSTTLQQLRQLYPVSERSLGRRLIFGVLCSCQHSGPSTSILIPLTFHCPGDRCPTVDISKALSKMCFLPVPAGPFWLVATLSPMICSFQDKVLPFDPYSPKCEKDLAIRVTQPLMSQINKPGRTALPKCTTPAPSHLGIRLSYMYLAPSTMRKRGTANFRALSGEFLELHMACRRSNIRHHAHSNHSIILWIYFNLRTLRPAWVYDNLSDHFSNLLCWDRFHHRLSDCVTIASLQEPDFADHHILLRILL